jgi:uncharacterized protein DUF4357
MSSSTPRAITIFLVSGNPNGIKKLEISNRTVRAYVLPRIKIPNAKQFTDLRQPALYFLFDKEGSHAYIGESENFFERVKNHDQNKAFWDVVVAFIDTSKSLDKGSVKYLESIAVETSIAAGRMDTDNKTIPPRNNLHEFKIPAVEEFFEDCMLLTSALGFPLFDKVKTDSVEEVDYWFCNGRKTRAKGIYSDEGFKVLAGSILDSSTVPSFASSFPKDYKDRQDKISINARRISDEQYELTHDLTYGSVSRASGFCLGRPSNGWQDWKNASGNTLDEVIRKAAK